MSRMLDKVSKLLNKAENAGTPEEAAAFMAKAQEMASINAIDLAVARMHQTEKERVQEVEERRVTVNTRQRRHNRKHFMELAMAIAYANDIEFLISGGEYALFAVGFPSDLDVLEALYVHLSVQMATECDEALKAGANKAVRRVLVTERREIAWEDREWGQWGGRTYYDDDPTLDLWCDQRDDESDKDFEKRYEAVAEKARADYLEAVANGIESYNSSTDRYRKPVPPPAYEEIPILDDDGELQYVTKEVSVTDGRVFRNEFYSAFVTRMRGRLWEARRAAERDRGIDVAKEGETALALRDKKKEVDEAHEKQRAGVRHLGTYRGADETNRKGGRGDGYQAGRAAAESVAIGAEGRGVKRA